MSQPGSPSLRTWLALAVYCSGSFTTMLNLGFLSPLLRPIGASFGVSDAVTGQLATLGALVTFVAALAATPWMDRWSRAAWYRLLGLLLLVGTLLSAAAPTFGVLVIARIVAALGASVVTANSMTGARELFPDAVWRNRAIGILVSATTFGFVAGLPAINQIAAHLNWRVAVASMALPVLIMIGGTWVLPPSSQFLASARQPALASFRAVLGSKRVRGILVALGLNLAMYTGWLVYFGAYITEVFSASAALLSTLFLISGLTELAANNLTPPVLRRFSAVPVLLVMLALAGGSPASHRRRYHHRTGRTGSRHHHSQHDGRRLYSLQCPLAGGRSFPPGGSDVGGVCRHWARQYPRARAGGMGSRSFREFRGRLPCAGPAGASGDTRRMAGHP
ncbi:MAG: MFS transporter [Thermomicrobiales bacterium]